MTEPQHRNTRLLIALLIVSPVLASSLGLAFGHLLT